MFLLCWWWWWGWLWWTRKRQLWLGSPSSDGDDGDNFGKGVYSAKWPLSKRMSPIGTPAVSRFFPMWITIKMKSVNCYNYDIMLRAGSTNHVLENSIALHLSLKTQNCANIFNWLALQCQARLWSFENVHTTSSSGCLHWSLQSAVVNCQFTTALLSTAQLHYIGTIFQCTRYDRSALWCSFLHWHNIAMHHQIAHMVCF